MCTFAKEGWQESASDLRARSKRARSSDSSGTAINWSGMISTTASVKVALHPFSGRPMVHWRKWSSRNSASLPAFTIARFRKSLTPATLPGRRTRDALLNDQHQFRASCQPHVSIESSFVRVKQRDFQRRLRKTYRSSPAISASLATVFMLRAVAALAAGILSLDCPAPSGKYA